MSEPRKFHGLLGGATLAVWSNIEPEDEPEFNNWYTHQHLPERISIPGFIRGRRYVKAHNSDRKERYFTFYEVRDGDVLKSPEYMQRLNNPTEWTRKVVPMMENSVRTAARVTTTLGQGIGGFAATFEFGPADGREEELRTYVTDVALPKILGHPDGVAAHLCEADVQLTKAKDTTEENKSVGDTDRPLARWFAIVEGTSESFISNAQQILTDPSSVLAHGTSSDFNFNPYRLLVSLSE